MKLLIVLSGIMCFVSWYLSRHNNPYTTCFIFGKKGSGKSTYMVKMMLRYKKRGWNIYTDMDGVCIPGVRYFNTIDLATFAPEPHSVLFLDEVGISFDNRNFKSFPPGMRDFFKYCRKMKCKLFINSQSYDVDKKIRDCVDNMLLLVSIGNVLSLCRPITRSITVTEPTGDSESRIADKLSIGNIFTWRFVWMPKYYKYFDSLSMPQREPLPYVDITTNPKKGLEISVKKSLQTIKHMVRLRSRRYGKG